MQTLGVLRKVTLGRNANRGNILVCCQISQHLNVTNLHFVSLLYKSYEIHPNGRGDQGFLQFASSLNRETLAVKG